MRYWCQSVSRWFQDDFSGSANRNCQIYTDSETGSTIHQCGYAKAECVNPGSCPNNGNDGKCSVLQSMVK
eukprot:UN10396